VLVITVGGKDIDVSLLVNLRRFIEENCSVGLCLVERGGALTHKHFHMVVKEDFSSLLALDKKN
jgi:hypothetical protein